MSLNKLTRNDVNNPRFPAGKYWSKWSPRIQCVYTIVVTGPHLSWVLIFHPCSCATEPVLVFSDWSLTVIDLSIPSLASILLLSQMAISIISTHLSRNGLDEGEHRRDQIQSPHAISAPLNSVIIPSLLAFHLPRPVSGPDQMSMSALSSRTSLYWYREV